MMLENLAVSSVRPDYRRQLEMDTQDSEEDFLFRGSRSTPVRAPELFPALVEGMSARQDLSPALGEAQRSLGPRRDSRADLNLPSKIAGSSSGSAPSRARKEGDAKGDLREAMGTRADMEQSLSRIRINAGAQAPEEAVGATIAIAKMIRVTGRPIGAGQAADSAGDQGAVRATGDGETRHLKEVAARAERHHHPRRQEEEAALEPVGRRWMDSGDLLKG